MVGIQLTRYEGGSKNRVGYKHISLGGSDTERIDYEIEQDWVQEIWDNS